jgi:hypothetical protein
MGQGARSKEQGAFRSSDCAAITGYPPSRSVIIALAKVTKAIADEEEIAFTISKGPRWR